MSLSMLAATLAIQSAGRLIYFEPSLVFPTAGQEVQVTYTNVSPGFDFTEVIPSWNVTGGQNASILLELRAHANELETKWYTLAKWSLDTAVGKASVERQKDDNGNVLTDTLRLAKPTRAVDLRVTARTLRSGELPRLKLLTLSFSAPGESPPELATPSAAWGKTIEVPQKAQGNYPKGEVLCSATSLSMVLCHYAATLGRSELTRDVPEVQEGVWDSVYDGAGNWPFNTAYAGSFDGMRSYVARLGSVSDLEKWIDAGIPVICSAPLDLLQGKPLKGDSGHLVVLVGFTREGDPVFNDPAKRDQVRRVYKRSDFEMAWNHSGRTVYIVHPESIAAPKGSNGLWIE